MARRKPLNPRKQPSQGRSRFTIRQIVEAAARVFEERGYAGATTNRIAERAGVSIGSLYQYFPNKESILVVLLEQHTQEVADAAAQGDRSENAEYIYGKKRLREIDRRIRFLRQRLEAVTVVRPGEVRDRSRAFFGAWVEVEDEEGETHRYRLVGPDEIDAKRGLISVHSPLGRVLIGKEEGDEVTVQRPAGEAVLS